MTDQWQHQMTDPQRLAALHDLDMLTAPGVIFDRITDLAARQIGTPVSLVSIIAADFQFNAGQHGVPEPARSERRLPLDYSYCKHLLGTSVPLIVPDTRQNPLLRDNLAIRDFNMIAYLGMPLRGNGKSLGSFCVLDSKVHHWTADEIQLIQELAQIINSEIKVRAGVGSGELPFGQLEEVREQISRLLDSLDTSLPLPQFLAHLRQQRRITGV